MIQVVFMEGSPGWLLVLAFRVFVACSSEIDRIMKN